MLLSAALRTVAQAPCAPRILATAAIQQPQWHCPRHLAILTTAAASLLRSPSRPPIGPPAWPLLARRSLSTAANPPPPPRDDNEVPSPSASSPPPPPPPTSDSMIRMDYEVLMRQIEDNGRREGLPAGEISRARRIVDRLILLLMQVATDKIWSPVELLRSLRAALHAEESPATSTSAPPLGSAGSTQSAAAASGGAGLSPDVPLYVAMHRSRGQKILTLIQLLISLIIAGWFATLLWSAYNKGGSGGGGGIFSELMDDPKMDVAEAAKGETTFADVVGEKEAKEDLQDIVQFLRDPERFQAAGAKLPKGVLLAGPPGVGKTLMARALAGEADASFFVANAAEFDEVFVGVGPRRIRKLFAQARESAPSVIFIDELDAMGHHRESPGAYRSHGTLQALLAEMDGFTQNEAVVVVAATNKPDVLDSALTRSGRFDRKVVLNLPTRSERAAIIKLYLKNDGDETVDIDRVARDTTGSSGADLANLVNLARIAAAKAGRTTVSSEMLQEAMEVVSMGRTRTTRELGAQVREITAYHEMGHALTGIATDMPISKITLIPRGQALGVTRYAPTEDDMVQMTKRQMEARLVMAMGGRAAEEIVLGADQVTSGASSDLQQATELATMMVRAYGMSSAMGPVAYGRETSPETQRKCEEEVRKLLEDSYRKALTILRTNRDILDQCSRALMEQETMSGEELRTIIAGRFGGGHWGAQLINKQ